MEHRHLSGKKPAPNNQQPEPLNPKPLNLTTDS